MIAATSGEVGAENSTVVVAPPRWPAVRVSGVCVCERMRVSERVGMARQMRRATEGAGDGLWSAAAR